MSITVVVVNLSQAAQVPSHPAVNLLKGSLPFHLIQHPVVEAAVEPVPLF